MTEDATEGPKSESISFVIVTENSARFAGTNLAAIKPCLRASDEVIVLTRADRQHEVTIREPWIRVVGIEDDPSLFGLRRHIPAICHGDWIIVLEEHSLVNGDTIDAIRELIRQRPDIDIIPFLAANLTSHDPWSWAGFLHSLAPIWAPLQEPPPFSQVTAVAVRHATTGSEVLTEGEWEFGTIPKIYASERIGYSNEIYIDHYRQLTPTGCLAVNFNNGWACTHMLRTLGIKPQVIRKDSRRLIRRRPQELMNSIRGREHELPTGTMRRLHMVGLAHFLGITIGSVFAAGRAAHRID